MVSMKDSKGQPSRTLALVQSAFWLLFVKFALAGLTIPNVGEFPEMTAGAVGGAVLAILTPWIGREFVKK